MIELESYAPPIYLPRLGYGHVPDPITLFDAAALIASEHPTPAPTHAQVYESLIQAFWRGEFERRPRTLIFAFHRPLGVWFDSDGGARNEKADRIAVRLRRQCWSRADARTVLRWEGRGDLLNLGRVALYRELSMWPLATWSDVARAMLWDRLCIRLADLAEWIESRGDPLPRRLTALVAARRASADRPPTSTVGTEKKCKAWLIQLMREGTRKPKDPLFRESLSRWPGLPRRSFDRAWNDALTETGVGWDKPGRPVKTNQNGAPE